MFDFKRFCEDFNIPTQTQGVNCSPGWINTRCPFCNDHSNHLGFNTYSGHLVCWKCNYHSNLDFLRTTLRVDWTKARMVIREYETDYIPVKKTEIKPADFLSLDFAKPLNKTQKKYLESRNYNPQKLERIWGLKGTGPVGDYKYRIIAPITYNNRLVSFQGRDYTGESSLRYKACSKEKEVVHYKNILYGLDKVKGRKCIVVEGITDVWRMGPGSIAVFGINYLPEQLLLIAERFSQVFVMFDEGDIAQEQANKLATGLSLMGLQVERCIIQGDPGNLPQEVANVYKKELIG